MMKILMMKIVMIMILGNHLQVTPNSHSGSGAILNAQLQAVSFWSFITGPPIDIEGLQAGKVDPQMIMQQSKKGKPLMIFVGVKDPPDQHYTEQISRIWAQSLMNAHIPVERSVGLVTRESVKALYVGVIQLALAVKWPGTLQIRVEPHN